MNIEMTNTEATIILGLIGDRKFTADLEELRSRDITTVAVTINRFVNAGLIEMDEDGPFVTDELEQAALAVAA